MITYTVAEFLDTFRLDCGNSCVYVFRNGTRVFYVGQSVATAGIVKRLDEHFWLKREYDGNLVKAYVLTEHTDRVRAKLGSCIKKCEPKSGGKTLLQIGVGGLDIAAQSCKSLKVKWGTDSPIGIYCLNNLPESRNWQIQLYTFDECRPAIDKYVRDKKVAVSINVNMAEQAMIYMLNPTLNYQHNRS